jgi:hypothetical protein
MKEPKTFELIDHYVNGMKEYIATNREYWRRSTGDDQATFLKDFATIGVTVPRQSGATFWVHTRAIADKDSMVIVFGQRDKDAAYNNFTHAGEYIPIHCGREVTAEEWLRRNEQRGLGAKFLGRFFTTDDVFQEMNSWSEGLQGHSPWIRGLGINKTIYLMGAGAIMSKVKRNKLYNWLANFTDPDSVIITVN